MLWVDKYRPTALDKLTVHEPITDQLQRLAAADNFPHLLVYGPSGAGKKTRVMALLRELFGSGVEKLKVDHKMFKTSSRVSVDITTVSSTFHIEINPSDVGYYDRVVVQEVIKEIAESPLIDSHSKHRFKVVVLNEVDKLTREAQQALRRTMEKYVRSCRLILVCSQSPHKVIDALRSRCLGVRVPAPEPAQVVRVLQAAAAKEGLKNVPAALLERIVQSSQCNMRRALLALETCRVQQYPFSADQVVPVADWEMFVGDLARFITQQQSHETLMAARSKLFELLTNAIPPTVVMRTLTLELLKRVDSDLKHEVVRAAAQCEARMQQGSKPIVHMEAFVARFMAMYKRYLAAMFA